MPRGTELVKGRQAGAKARGIECDTGTCGTGTCGTGTLLSGLTKMERR